MEAKTKLKKIDALFVADLVRTHKERKQLPADKLKELKTLACEEEGGC